MYMYMHADWKAVTCRYENVLDTFSSLPLVLRMLTMVAMSVAEKRLRTSGLSSSKHWITSRTLCV